MKKELAALGSMTPLLTSLGIGGIAIGGASFLAFFIYNTLNEKDMALTNEDKKFIKDLIEPINKRLGHLENTIGGFVELWSGPGLEQFG